MNRPPRKFVALDINVCFACKHEWPLIRTLSVVEFEEKNCKCPKCGNDDFLKIGQKVG